MSKTPRHVRWLVGGILGFSLLSGCGASDEQLGDTSPVQEAVAGDISVQLSMGASSLSKREDVQVTVTLTNVSNHAVQLLKRDTPVDGIDEPLFAVTRDGAEVQYIGRHYKWGTPRPEDFLTLAAGESITRTVSLAEAYDFSQTGRYTLGYAQAGGHHAPSQFVSNTVDVWIEGRPQVLPELAEGVSALAMDGEVSAMALSTANCTAARASQISTAVSSAMTYASGAQAYMDNTTPGNTARYKTWFGTYTASRWSTVRSHFTSIYSSFLTKSVVVDCNCTKANTYAYVIVNQPYRIYVCGKFWTAPNTGTDSRAGTMVHEMSHFTVVAATDDHQYGQTSCKALAISNPALAVDNADSHEYFAENTPYQN